MWLELIKVAVLVAIMPHVVSLLKRQDKKKLNDMADRAIEPAKFKALKDKLRDLD